MKKDILKGKVFCFTGTLSKPRKMFQEFVEALGGTFTNTLTSRVTALVVGDSYEVSAKELKAIDLDIPEITERDLYTMAGITLEDFRKQLREERNAIRREYETSYEGKFDRLKASAIVSIGKLGTAMVIPGEKTRIYVHYQMNTRTHSAVVKCISANGVAFCDRNGKSCFYGWEQLEASRLMEVADYLAKRKDTEADSFRRRLYVLNREFSQRNP